MTARGGVSDACPRARQPRPAAIAAVVIAAAAALVASSSASAAPAASFEVAVRGLPCPSSTELPEHITRLLASKSPPLQATVEIALEFAPPDVLVVHLRQGARSDDRALHFVAGDCAALAPTLASIVHGWLRQPWDELDSGGRATSRATALAPASPGTGVTGLRANRAAARTPPPSSGWYALAAGSGFTALGAARQAGPGLLAAIERDLGATGFGVGLAGAWDSPVERALGSGTVSVARWELALLARAAIRRWDGGGLEALAGPALQIIEARTRGLAVDANGRYPQLGADLQLRARQRLTSRVELVAAVGLSARREGQRFHVPNAPGDLPVPAWRLQAAVGLRFGL